MAKSESELNQNYEPEPGTQVNKIIVGYDNGKVRYLEGDAAARFFSEIVGAAGFTQMRTSHFIPRPNWKWVNAENVGRLFENESS